MTWRVLLFSTISQPQDKKKYTFFLELQKDEQSVWKSPIEFNMHQVGFLAQSESGWRRVKTPRLLADQRWAVESTAYHGGDIINILRESSSLGWVSSVQRSKFEEAIGFIETRIAEQHRAIAAQEAEVERLREAAEAERWRPVIEQSVEIERQQRIAAEQIVSNERQQRLAADQAREQELLRRQRAETDVQRLEAELAQLRNEKAGLQSELTQQRNEITCLQQEKSAAEQSISQNQQQYTASEQAKDQALEKAEAETQRLRAELAQQRNEITCLQQEKRATEQSISQKQQQYTASEQARDQALQKAEAETQNLKAELAQLRNEKAGLQSELTQQKNDHMNLLYQKNLAEQTIRENQERYTTSEQVKNQALQKAEAETQSLKAQLETLLKYQPPQPQRSSNNVPSIGPTSSSENNFTGSQPPPPKRSCGNNLVRSSSEENPDVQNQVKLTRIVQALSCVMTEEEKAHLAEGKLVISFGQPKKWKELLQKRYIESKNRAEQTVFINAIQCCTSFETTLNNYACLSKLSDPSNISYTININNISVEPPELMFERFCKKHLLKPIVKYVVKNYGGIIGELVGEDGVEYAFEFFNSDSDLSSPVNFGEMPAFKDMEIPAGLELDEETRVFLDFDNPKYREFIERRRNEICGKLPEKFRAIIDSLDEQHQQNIARDIVLQAVQADMRTLIGGQKNTMETLEKIVSEQERLKEAKRKKQEREEQHKALLAGVYVVGKALEVTGVPKEEIKKITAVSSTVINIGYMVASIVVNPSLSGYIQFMASFLQNLEIINHSFSNTEDPIFRELAELKSYINGKFEVVIKQNKKILSILSKIPLDLKEIKRSIEKLKTALAQLHSDYDYDERRKVQAKLQRKILDFKELEVLSRQGIDSQYQRDYLALIKDFYNFAQGYSTWRVMTGYAPHTKPDPESLLPVLSKHSALSEIFGLLKLIGQYIVREREENRIELQNQSAKFFFNLPTVLPNPLVWSDCARLMLSAMLSLTYTVSFTQMQVWQDYIDQLIKMGRQLQDAITDMTAVEVRNELQQLMTVTAKKLSQEASTVAYQGLGVLKKEFSENTKIEVAGEILEIPYFHCAKRCIGEFQSSSDAPVNDPDNFSKQVVGKIKKHQAQMPAGTSSYREAYFLVYINQKWHIYEGSFRGSAITIPQFNKLLSDSRVPEGKHYRLTVIDNESYLVILLPHGQSLNWINEINTCIKKVINHLKSTLKEKLAKEIHNLLKENIFPIEFCTQITIQSIILSLVDLKLSDNLSDAFFQSLSQEELLKEISNILSGFLIEFSNEPIPAAIDSLRMEIQNGLFLFFKKKIINVEIYSMREWDLIQDSVQYLEAFKALLKEQQKNSLSVYGENILERESSRFSFFPPVQSRGDFEVKTPMP